MVCGLFAVEAILADDYRRAYLWLAIAVIIDCSDGPIARRVGVKERLPEVDGTLLDNIVDYVTWTFVPVFLIWRAGWLVSPAELFCGLALLSSLYAFVHTGAKESDLGFFRGFPSFWNFFAFYADLSYRQAGQAHLELVQWVVTVALVLCVVLSFAPVYFLYPNRSERWRPFFIYGGVVWAVQCFMMIVWYPEVPTWFFLASFIYPTVYIGASLAWTPTVWRRLNEATDPSSSRGDQTS